MAKKIDRTPLVTDDLSDLISTIVDNVNKNIKNEDIKVTVGDDDSEYGMAVPYWVKTNIPQLDYAVGGINHPGFPGARITEISGGEGSGKSTLAVWLAKCAIEQLNTFALYQDAENVLTNEIIKGTGLNMKRVIRQNPETIEEAFQTQESILDTLDKKIEKKPVISVLDSVAACPTEAELDADYGDSTMAQLARALSTAMKKIKSRILSNQVLSIFVNQVRDNMNVSWGKKTTTPGGRALPFYASVRIELVRTEWVKGKNASEKVGGIYKATLIKNKVAPPMKTAEFQIDFVEEQGGSYPRINTWKAVLDWCKEHELIEGSQGRVVLKGKSMYLKDAVKLLQEDDDLYEELLELAYSVGQEDEEEE